MEKTLKVTRRELKYFINEVSMNEISKIMSKVLIADEHNLDGGYHIRSLYFDSYENTDFYEKMIGIENRKKIRLRIYSSEDTKAKLEIKRKYNNNQIKSSVIISREDAIELIKQNYDVLNKYQSATAKTIMNIMKVNSLVPVVLIEYRRKAFIHPMNKTRITLDSKIYSSETFFDIFAKDPPLVPIDDNVCLLEVKYNGFLLGFINDIINSFDLSRTSFSKYTSSRNMFENYLG
ncbi:MAG: polyphosphate polymerase domain-containing protein [bacterium]|nr:polyphosphate polymerase domain-containing protein [bacterium]